MRGAAAPRGGFGEQSGWVTVAWLAAVLEAGGEAVGGLLEGPVAAEEPEVAAEEVFPSAEAGQGLGLGTGPAAAALAEPPEDRGL